jgi:hypothetical protein
MVARAVSSWYHKVVSRGAAMKTISLRINDDGLARRLEQESHRRGSSINGLILEAIRSFLGVPGSTRGGGHHDLDHLAGTWSEADEREFAEAVQGFAAIDEEMWR